MISTAIHYQIQALPLSHCFAVTMTIKDPDPAGQQLSLPTWIPGSYMIRDFAKHLSTLSANVGLEKIDKTTWLAQPCQEALVISYQVYAWDLSVRGAHVDETHAFYNGTSVFLAVVGQEENACTVEIIKPQGEAYLNWRVATSLAEAGAKRYGFGTYQADNYDELIDHPVEMADFTLDTFSACGIEHDVVLTGQHQADRARLCRDLQKVCETQLQFFGEPYPMKRYVFLVLVLGQGFGGLEHRASTSLHCSRHELPRLGQEADKVSSDYRNFLTLCSHEYFHTWNIKRIKPAAYLPYDLSQESYSNQLWIFEGFTRYYESVMLLRAGVINDADYLQELAELITQLQRTPGRLKQSVADSSFDAWTKFYKQDENAANAIISYYTKGGVVALLLDLTIQAKTQGEKSLDDLMHRLWQDYGQASVGVAEGEVETIVAELLGAADPIGEFFQHTVYGVEELPIVEALATAGIVCEFRHRVNQADRGGIVAEDPVQRLELGFRAKKTAEGLEILLVLNDSAAEKAGIAPGDVLIALDGLKIQQAWEKQFQLCQADETVALLGFRRDELKNYQLTPVVAKKDTCVLRRQASLL